MAAIVALAALLLWHPLPKAVPARAAGVEPMPLGRWLPALLPMLLLSVVATAIPPLMQSALPLDLVRGGLERDAQPEAISALLIGIPLVLLLLIQWPVGQALARRSVAVGLRLSLLCFSGGTALMALSALSEGGLGLVVLALVLLAFGQAAFLPTATEAVVELSPKGHGGLAMALFSQCFALSAFGAPLIAGLLLDHQGHGLVLWLLVALVCTLSLLLIGPIQRRADAKG
jgi:MFS family permease